MDDIIHTPSFSNSRFELSKCSIAFEELCTSIEWDPGKNFWKMNLNEVRNEYTCNSLHIQQVQVLVEISLDQLHFDDSEWSIKWLNPSISLIPSSKKSVFLLEILEKAFVETSSALDNNQENKRIAFLIDARLNSKRVNIIVENSEQEGYEPILICEHWIPFLDEIKKEKFNKFFIQMCRYDRKCMEQKCKLIQNRRQENI